MNVGIIGLGRMGEALVYRATQAGHTVVAYDIDSAVRKKIESASVRAVDTLEQMAKEVSIIWLMVPAAVVDQTLDQLFEHMSEGTIIIDGGNSKFTDSIDRAQRLESQGFSFIDCGTSGGLYGREYGFSLMIGGRKNVYDSLDPLWKAIAAPEGYGYMGSSGAGHYVKMVHNGIEYALLEAYAEGFNLLKHGSFKSADLDLEKITKVWQHGSVIRSWILELSHTIFKEDQKFDTISGAIGQLGTGQWTVDEAQKNKIPVDCIERAVQIRTESEKTGGNYATKIVALLRRAFGGHPVQEKK